MINSAASSRSRSGLVKHTKIEKKGAPPKILKAPRDLCRHGNILLEVLSVLCLSDKMFLRIHQEILELHHVNNTGRDIRGRARDKDEIRRVEDVREADDILQVCTDDLTIAVSLKIKHIGGIDCSKIDSIPADQ